MFLVIEGLTEALERERKEAQLQKEARKAVEIEVAHRINSMESAVNTVMVCKRAILFRSFVLFKPS